MTCLIGPRACCIPSSASSSSGNHQPDSGRPHRPFRHADEFSARQLRAAGWFEDPASAEGEDEVEVEGEQGSEAEAGGAEPRLRRIDGSLARQGSPRGPGACIPGLVERRRLLRRLRRLSRSPALRQPLEAGAGPRLRSAGARKDWRPRCRRCLAPLSAGGTAGLERCAYCDADKRSVCLNEHGPRAACHFGASVCPVRYGSMTVESSLT